jgi:hypothetical protein
MKPRAIPFWLFITLWLVSLALPLCLLYFSPWLAVLLGIVLPIAWVLEMPTGCINGAFIAFPMAMFQMGAFFMWLIIGIKLWRQH